MSAHIIISLTETEATRIRRGELREICRVIDPQPDPRWNHHGGRWFCRGEHEKGDKCSARAEEIPCPFGEDGEELVDPAHHVNVRAEVIRVEKIEGLWRWKVEFYVVAA